MKSTASKTKRQAGPPSSASTGSAATLKRKYANVTQAYKLHQTTKALGKLVTAFEALAADIIADLK